MSRESQHLQRGIRQEELRNDGLPLTEEQRALYILTQRQLIGFLSQRMAFLDPLRGMIDCECLVAIIISEVYHDWFHEQVDVLLEERFVNLYKGMHGPRNLFQALFPDQEIDDFLNNHLKKANAEMVHQTSSEDLNGLVCEGHDLMVFFIPAEDVEVKNLQNAQSVEQQ